MYRRLSSEGIYHIYNRGVSKMTIFNSLSDYNRFIAKMYEFSVKDPITIYSYCLMPNHYHFLLKDENTTDDATMNIPRFMKNLQYSHARYFNRKYGHKGHVFESEYKSKRIKDDVYFREIVDYIYNNPVKSGLVDKPEQWKYSKKFTW